MSQNLYNTFFHGIQAIIIQQVPFIKMTIVYRIEKALIDPNIFFYTYINLLDNC
jgi:hypothetical protein